MTLRTCTLSQMLSVVMPASYTAPYEITRHLTGAVQKYVLQYSGMLDMLNSSLKGVNTEIL